MEGMWAVGPWGCVILQALPAWCALCSVGHAGLMVNYSLQAESGLPLAASSL